MLALFHASQSLESGRVGGDTVDIWGMLEDEGLADSVDPLSWKCWDTLAETDCSTLERQLLSVFLLDLRN